MARAFIVPYTPMPEPIFSFGSILDIQVAIHTEQHANPNPLMILAMMTTISFGAKIYPTHAAVMNTAPINESLYLLILSARFPAIGRQSRDTRFIRPPTSPIRAAEAPILSVNPVISGVTSMGLAI